ncbi:MAG: HD domain-containing protein [Deltaproteobacteria bacterium]|nr:HD domain-containing protein [Deltaproteobacteria bacterium]
MQAALPNQRIAPRTPVRALYVDDEELLLRTMARALSSRVQLETVSSSAEAVARVRSGVYQLVIADLVMPQYTGIEVLRAAREANPDTIRVLISAGRDFETAVAAVNGVGIYRYLTKPWDTQQLHEAVDSALALIEMRAENELLKRDLHARNGALEELNRMLDRQVAERTTSLLQGLTSALDLRDTETQSHSRRVALYARRLAEELGLGPTECLEIERGALLHDIGKIGVSDTILLKPAKLTEEEWVEMRKHATYGAQILEKLHFLGRAREVVTQHHERWNGGGYPRGLRGEEIYIGARIFAVIDAYDAITSDRPYRKGRPYAVALEEIRKYQDVQFDARVVDAFAKIPVADLDAIRDRCEHDESSGLD